MRENRCAVIGNECRVIRFDDQFIHPTRTETGANGIGDGLEWW